MRTILAALITASLAMAASDYFVYTGTYTTGSSGSKGIYGFRFNPADGKLTDIGLMAETPSPSFLTVHPNGKYLYAVNELDSYQGQKSGSVTAYKMDTSNGKLTLLNTVAAKGTGSCHLVVDKTGKNLLVANYNSGSFAVFALKPDGSIGDSTAFIQESGSGPDKRRQQGPHAHSVNLPASNRFMVGADLGTDKLMIFKFDAAKGTLTANDPPYGEVKPGSGPRHFVFHPDGKYAYSVNEMASTVVAFHWDGARGKLDAFQTISTLPPDFKGSTTTAEIAIDKKGRFLYASNRGHDSIAVFAIASDGKLTSLEQVSTQGGTPRNFALDPTGKFLLAANQKTNNLVVFKVNPQSGRLTPNNFTVATPSPVCLTFAAVK